MSAAGPGSREGAARSAVIGPPGGLTAPWRCGPGCDQIATPTAPHTVAAKAPAAAPQTAQAVAGRRQAPHGSRGEGGVSRWQTPPPYPASGVPDRPFHEVPRRLGSVRCEAVRLQETEAR
ncbi:hypothetical protein Sfulv_58240 [Streptomyces fulvorobeus]|uniref:Uncharacterized protein n=1 Tax=Streptomyces fulvorobeus TaxID=284028 RepID=A0A7J0CGI3_9ACTN|nr:hypothetical protein Sfulv_58240 [Streptomyces fulvorobeus]